MNDVVLTKADAQEATMEELSELQRIEDNIFRLLGFDGTCAPDRIRHRPVFTP